jgi:acyl carrier protein
MATEEKKDVMTFDEFRAVMAESLIMNPEQLVPEAHFITDLAVDSIRFVELYLKFQELGIEIREDAVWEIQTVGDAYNFYKTNAEK